MDETLPKVIDMDIFVLTVTHKDAKSVTYHLKDTEDNKEETITCSREAFELALKAAEDDMPISEEEYALAETAIGEIRWIP